VELRAGFDVNGEGGGSCLSEGFQECVGILDHEVNVEGKLSRAAAGGDHDRSHRQVGREMSVYDINVNPVCTRIFGFFDLVTKDEEVSRENGGSEVIRHD